MAGQSDFTPEEWQTILESTMMAGVAVSAADPSGLFGVIQESVASARAVHDTDRSDRSPELLREISAELDSHDRRQAVRDAIAESLWGSPPPEVIEKALETLSRAAALVAAKAPEDAPAFKTWLRAISSSVAEAATEGGFLGFGGVRVSPSEKATLAQISATLGIAA